MTVEVNSAETLYQRNSKSTNRCMTPASSKVLFLMYFLVSTQSVHLCFVPIGSLLFLKIFMSGHITSEVYTYILNSNFFMLCFDVLLYSTLVIHESIF